MAEEKDLDIHFLGDVQHDMDADPELAAAVRNFCASIRQAHHSVQTGQHATMEDAMEAITGKRPKHVMGDDGLPAEETTISVSRARRQDPFTTASKPDFVTRLWLAFAMARSVMRWRR